MIPPDQLHLLPLDFQGFLVSLLVISFHISLYFIHVRLQEFELVGSNLRVYANWYKKETCHSSREKKTAAHAETGRLSEVHPLIEDHVVHVSNVFPDAIGRDAIRYVTTIFEQDSLESASCIVRIEPHE